MSNSILLVDDELEMCVSLSEILTSEGYEVTYTTDPTETLNILKSININLVIMDIKMPKVGGLELLKLIKKLDPSVPVIMISGYPSFDNAVKAMKYGAINFFSKPPKIEEVLKELKQLLTSYSTKRNSKNKSCSKMVTADYNMQKILREIEKVGPTDAPVLITGDSGTGKELAANYLHSLSKRSDKALIKMNCAALQDTLIESELFGHERGSFTDARKQHKGRFELADKGTIFLDEIGDMSLITQAKILRVLQEQEFVRVGGTDIVKTDVRIIAATNKSIFKLIKEYRFREDLYYRLSVITIHLPRLADRRDDIMPLVNHYISHFNAIYNKKIEGVIQEVEHFFLTHDWPGNIRELMNCVERAVIFCEEKYINARDLPTQYADLVTQDQPLDFNSIMNYKVILGTVEKSKISEALAQCKGSREKTAKRLNISRRTLYNKMKKYGLD